MEKKTILKGMWWVKGNEDKKFMGILRYGGGYAPALEILLKEYDLKKRPVPNNCTIFGNVFGESKKIQAVTLLKCTSQKPQGMLVVGAFIYRQGFVNAHCVAIGMHLDDDEIAQLQFPQNIYLTCPGLDEYSIVDAIEDVWKNNIPDDRPYLVSDLERIVYNQQDPIEIEIDIGTITIYLGQSRSSRDISSHYGIQISLASPTSEAEVNTLIYSQWLSFLSIMTGRSEYVENHNITIHSNQLGTGTLSIELNYGHIAHAAQETEYSFLQALMIGSEENMRKFATLFPKWRTNFEFVGDWAFRYLQMVDQSTITNILQIYPAIETYVLERVAKKNMKSMSDILSAVINSNADYFQSSPVYAQHFPRDGIAHIAEQLANFRHNRIHPKSNKECEFSLQQVYAYIDVILRSIFLKEMEYSYDDIDREINHWQSWRLLDGE
ncbi:MAG: hypothetical protein OXI34_03365 [Chloroflexota bacterium]|nr:hypothetical protein [Chloroflexota bacterium]MDE2947760.1 hypothetical protein [Chloroflexota bacterium]